MLLATWTAAVCTRILFKSFYYGMLYFSWPNNVKLLTCQIDLFAGSQEAVSSSYYSSESRASVGVNGMGGVSGVSSMSAGWGM